jgi:hypothetical protein
VWTGAVSAGQVVTISFPITISTAASQAIINEALLVDPILGSASASARVIANGWQVWLPILRR